MKKKIVPLLRILFSLGLMALLYRKVSWADLREVFTGMNPAWLALIYALLLINTCISSFKWRMFLRADNIRIPFLSLVRKYLIGSFFSMFLPSNIGGDAYRVYAVARKGSSTARSFASVLADRMSGFIAVVVLGFVFCVIARNELPDRRILLIPIGAFLLLCGVLAVLFEQRFARRALHWRLIARSPRLQKFGHGLLDTVRLYRQSPALLFRVMALSFVFQFNAIVILYCLSRALGLEVEFHYFCMYVPIITLLEALPISIFGLGIRDGSYVYFFVPVGLLHHEALVLALAYVFVAVTYCASGGVLFALQRHKPHVQPLETNGTQTS